MAEPFTTSRLREAPAAEAAARIAPRRKTADQRLRILERLTMGLTVAHIARVEQLTARRAPQIIAEMLARREIDPPAGFAQFADRAAERSDDRRASDDGGQSPGDGSIDQADERTRPLSRLRAGPNSLGEGCGGAPRRAGAPRDLATEAFPLPGSRRRRLTAKRTRPEMAPQRLEKIESGPGNGMVSEASNPQDVVRGRAVTVRGSG